MSEVTAQMIEQGRAGDPTAASRRRKMNIKLRHARQTLTSATGEHSGPYDSLVRLFARSAKLVTPAFAVLASAAGYGAYFWLGWDRALQWGAVALSALALRYFLGWTYLRRTNGDRSPGWWRLWFVCGEAYSGLIWAALFYTLLRSHDLGARGFAVVAVMLLSCVVAMTASAIPAAVAAALLPTMVAVIFVFGPPSLHWAAALSLLCAAILVCLVAVTNAMHKSALAGFSFQEEKEALIAELEQAKLNSDEARRRAEGANLAKSRFLATMSHELRTPLNAILGFSEVMQAELFGAHAVAAYKEYASDIHSSGQHLLMLINEILDLSRVEAGRYELKEEAVSLPGVVDECRHLLALRAKNRAITVNESLDEELPRIWADERAIRQVTLNLLSNAIKFTPQGGEITIKVGAAIGGGQCLSIRDTGPGIPEEEIPIVLSSFGRGSMAQKNADEGSGLGLPIVRGLVELHGGEFRLTSKIREGTEVLVIFPPERVMNALPQIDPDAPTEAEIAKKAALRARRRGGRAAA
jgi:two-component system cell cycle sensor histidine kinase PleC